MRFAERIYTSDGRAFDVEMEIDLKVLIFDLGWKAAKNKTKKTSAVRGAIKVKAKAKTF